MANNNDGIKTKVGLMGDKEYKQGLSQISRQLAVLNSDMKASQSAFGKQADSMDAMHDRMEKLGEIYEVQSKKVELIREQLEKAEEVYGKNSKQADELRIALNRATAQMNNTGNQIKQTEGDLAKLADAQAVLGEEVINGSSTLKDAEKAMSDMAKASAEAAEAAEEAGDATEDAGDKADSGAGGMDAFKTALGAVGDVADNVKSGIGSVLDVLGDIGSAAAAAISEAFGLAKDAGKYADDLLTLSSQVGVDTDKLQQWQYASNFIDTSVETITGSMTKLTKKMASAQEEEKTQAEKWQEHLAKIAKGEKDTWSEVTTARDAFVTLGVSWTDFSGQLRDSEDVFMDCIDALGKIENPTERDALAMELFGKSAKELNPLIEAGSRAWRDMGKEAEAMGTVFSHENLDKMGAFDDSMQRFNATGQALANSIGLTVIPAFQPLVDAAANAMGGVSKALQEGVSPAEFEALMDDVLDDVEDALKQTGQFIEENLPVATEMLTRVADMLADALPGLVQALLPGAIRIVEGLGDAIAENAEAIGELAAAVMTAIGTALVTALPKIIEKLPEIFQGIWEGLTDSDWPGLGGDILGKIMEGLGGFGEKVAEIFTGGRDEAAKIDWDGVKEDLKAVGATLMELVPEVLAAGLEGAHGIIEGLNWPALGETIGHIANGLLGLTGELIAAPLEAGYGLIKGIDWMGLGETLAVVPNGLMDISGELLAQGFQNGHDLIEKINWSGLTDAMAAVPNGLIAAAGVGGEALSAPFELAYGVIKDINWEGLGSQIGDGLGRGLGVLAGVGDVALGLGEAAVGAGQQGVNALKKWISSWGEDEGVETEATAVGAGVITDISTGVTDTVPDLETTAEEASNKLLDAIRGVLTEETVEKIGKDLDEDLWTGIVLGEDELLDVIGGVAGDAYDELTQAVTDAKFDNIGEQMDNGVIEGINRGSPRIESAARAAAAAAYAAACAELQVNSPSKKGAYLGEMFDLGFAEGLMDNADEIEDAMGYLNGLAVAEPEPGFAGFGGSGTQAASEAVDYAAIRDAFVEAIEETGVGYNVIAMDGQIVGETIEPYSSRATAQRQKQSVKGRTARLVMA
ncbi:MAG: hypothetical protein IJ124_05300 [Clostridia bacterium]|nr:hypothetical protein [Clostridia bacterium]